MDGLMEMLATLESMQARLNRIQDMVAAKDQRIAALSGELADALRREKELREKLVELSKAASSLPKADPNLTAMLDYCRDFFNLKKK